MFVHANKVIGNENLLIQIIEEFYLSFYDTLTIRGQILEIIAILEMLIILVCLIFREDRVEIVL